MVSYPYSVLRIEPDPIRGESINMGVVVALHTGLDVRFANSTYKLRVLHPLFDTKALTELAELLKQMDSMLRASENAPGPDERLRALSQLGLCNLSQPGYFSAAKGAYEAELKSLMDEMVNPPTAIAQGTQRFSRLESQIKKDFRKRGLLSEEPDGINDRRVVHRYPILPDENLVADFAYRSDHMIVVAAVDFRAKPETLRVDKHKQTAVKSIMLDRATALFQAKPMALIAANEEQLELASHSIKMLNDYADQVFNILIPDENKAFFEHFSKLIGQDKKTSSSIVLH